MVEWLLQVCTIKVIICKVIVAIVMRMHCFSSR
jgi:hypothetical protein